MSRTRESLTGSIRCCGSERSLVSSPRRGRRNFYVPPLGLDRGADRTAGREDHDCSLGDCHHMLFAPGGLSVIACPAQRQSAEAVRRVRDPLNQVGAKFKSTMCMRSN